MIVFPRFPISGSDFQILESCFQFLEGDAHSHCNTIFVVGIPKFGSFYQVESGSMDSTSNFLNKKISISRALNHNKVSNTQEKVLFCGLTQLFHFSVAKHPDKCKLLNFFEWTEHKPYLSSKDIELIQYQYGRFCKLD